MEQITEKIAARFLRPGSDHNRNFRAGGKTGLPDDLSDEALAKSGDGKKEVISDQ
jgi:hypothetical protein